MTVTLAPVGAGLRDRVLALAPRPEQVPFSGLPAETLRAADADPARVPVAILADGAPVGLFVLDAAGGGPLAAGPGDLVLRAFFVDAAEQGRGIAGAALAALPAFVAAHRPGTRAVLLSPTTGLRPAVPDQRNAPARRVYERAGFAATGAVVLGPAGPQDVLRLVL